MERSQAARSCSPVTALLAVLLAAAGCGPVHKAGQSAPVADRYLVYEKVIGEKGIWIAEADGSRPRLLALDGHSPVVSPDGKWVVYSGDCAERNNPTCDSTYLVSTAAEKPHRLPHGISGTVEWSPDSKRIVGGGFSGDDLVSIDVARGTEVELAKGKFWGWSLSPDGKQIVFARLDDPNGEPVLGTKVNLFVTRLDGGEAKRITHTGDAAEPVWGPKSIAFSKLISCLPPTTQETLDGCRNNTWGRHEIWRVQPDGTDRTNITGSLAARFQMQGCVGLAPIDWSEDGRALLGAWRCEFSAEPVAVDPETGASRHLGWGSDTVALSADGQFALVQSGTGAETADEDQQVLIYSLAGGNPKVVAHGAVSPTWNR